MTEDLPTLLLPMNAYSGLSGLGHCLKSGLLMRYLADLMIMRCKILDARYWMQDAVNLNFGTTYKFGCWIPDADNLKFGSTYKFGCRMPDTGCRPPKIRNSQQISK